MRTISLDHLSVLSARPSELVEIAARAGFGAIGPITSGGMLGDVAMVELAPGAPETLAMKRRLRDTGVFINNADGFLLGPGTLPEMLRPRIELMAELGARGIITLLFDPDPARGFDNLCALRDITANAGLPLLLEFTPISCVAGLDDALRLRARVGHGIGILVDLFHLNRTAGTPADIARLAPGVVQGAQLCDGPRVQTDEEYLDQVLYARMVPGEGELPVDDFVTALPPDLIFGVEVPLRDAIRAGEDHFARACRLMDATRAVLSRIGDSI